MMYLAKPNNKNLTNSRQFATMLEAMEYLNEVTASEDTVAMPIDEWIVIGKLLQVNEDGSMTMPTEYPKKVKGEIKMVKLDIDSYL
jgi:hypothetical protein